MRKFDWRGLIQYQSASVLMIVFGGILTVCPDSISILISAVLGWFLIVMGVVLVIVGLTGGIAVVPTIQGAVILVAGAWLHRHPLMIASSLGGLLGLAALGRSWQKGRRALRARRYGRFWVWDAGVAVLELLAGLVLILTPLSLSRALVTFAGIFMVICGAADLFAFWKSGGGPGGYSNIIDADS